MPFLLSSHHILWQCLQNVSLKQLRHHSHLQDLKKL
nr:MAG TPA: hypothetical protein [Caudoviricetes sp.]